MDGERILFIEFCNFTDYPLGGHLSFAKHLTRAMAGGMDLVGLTTDAEEPVGEWQAKIVEGAEYRVLNVARVVPSSKRPLVPSRVTNYFLMRRFASRIEWGKYPVILIQTPEILFAVPKAVLSRVILVMPGVGNPLAISRYPWARRLAWLYDRVFFRRAGRVRRLLAAADKEAVAGFVARGRGWISASKVLQFPTRYDEHIFHVREAERLRERQGIPTTGKLIVTTGRLNWFKGWQLMLDAFFLFRKRHEGARFVFIGDGEDRPRIEEYARSHAALDEVMFLGQQSLATISEWLCMADLFVMGSFKEGWSTSLVEATACGAACVVTDFSSAAEMVEDGVNGFVLHDRDARHFAEAMEKALSLDKGQLRKTAQGMERLAVKNMRQDFLNAIKG